MQKKQHKSNLNFPKNFLWGVATSAHQIEGNSDNNDWSLKALKKHSQNIKWAKNAQEKIPDAKQACQSWEKYKEDVELAKNLNCNLYRFSVEWSKIEPECGKFDQKAIEHYRDQIKQAKKANMQIMLTLHHFTNPIWFSQKKGWEKRSSLKYYLRFVKKIINEYENQVDYWITLNEPFGWTSCAYFMGIWPPFKKNYLLGYHVFNNLALAHKRAYKLIHKYYRNKGLQKPKVGFVNDLQSYSNYRKHSLLEQLKVYFIYNFSNHSFIKKSGKKYHDFFGVNYYYEMRVNKKTGMKMEQTFNAKDENRQLTDMEWLIYPRGIFDVLYDLNDYGKPFIIAENGIATKKDELRIRFIEEHLEEIYYAIKAGIDVRGYCYWSLLDNYEWAEGYRPKFGLVKVDLKTGKRTPKDSYKFYAKIIQDNGLYWNY